MCLTNTCYTNFLKFRGNHIKLDTVIIVYQILTWSKGDNFTHVTKCY